MVVVDELVEPDPELDVEDAGEDPGVLDEGDVEEAGVGAPVAPDVPEVPAAEAGPAGPKTSSPTAASTKAAVEERRQWDRRTRVGRIHEGGDGDEVREIPDIGQIRWGTLRATVPTVASVAPTLTWRSTRNCTRK